VSSSSHPTREEQAIEVQSQDRWQIYHRLQELEIPCQCAFYQPLMVWVDHPLAAIQVWSVVQQVTTRRQQQIDRLEACWQA
jgi:hypothetical protein